MAFVIINISVDVFCSTYLLFCRVLTKPKILKRCGTRIRDIRIQKEMTQKELAWKCGKDPQSLERVENGKSNPTIFYLYEIAEGLEIPVKTLIDF